MNVNFVLSGIRHGSVHCVLQVDYIDMQEEPVIGSFLQKQFDKRTGSVISAEEWFFYGLIGTEMHEVEIDGKSIIGARGGIPIIGEIPTEILIPGIRKNLRIIFLI